MENEEKGVGRVGGGLGDRQRNRQVNAQAFVRTGLNFLWPKMGRLGPSSWTPKIPPEKVYVGPLFALFPQEMRHINFLRGGPKWVVLGGGQKVYVAKVYVLSRSPTTL